MSTTGVVWRFIGTFRLEPTRLFIWFDPTAGGRMLPSGVDTRNARGTGPWPPRCRHRGTRIRDRGRAFTRARDEIGIGRPERDRADAIQRVLAHPEITA